MGATVGGGGRRGGRHRALAEINIAPLVDVMLVLLIISMLASPMLQRGIHLDLPRAQTSTETDTERVVVSVDRDAAIRINDRPVHIELLEQRMRDVAATSPGETVYLRGDRLVPYGDVLSVMDRIRKAGVSKVALVTAPSDVPTEPEKKRK